MDHKIFKGSGGGGDAGGSDFTNTPDNLRSTDTFEGLMGMCVGPIKGPVGDLNGVIMDGTPILDEAGQENFPEFLAVYSDGDPTKFPQLVDLRLGAASAPLNINVGIPNTNDGPGVATPGPFVSRSLANVAPNYLDLRFVVQGLYRQDEDGVWTTKATLEIQMKKSGSSTWINPTISDGDAWTGGDQGSKSSNGIRALFPRSMVDQEGGGVGGENFVIDGKTTTPTVTEVRIWVPNEGAYSTATWDVRVRLLERDDYTNDDDVEQRQILWESMAAIYDETIGEEEEWRGLAWLQLYGKATDNLTGVPDVEVIADTKIVSVPPSGVWNAGTRVYTGSIWDGSWAKEYTNDPAWIINDAISDPLSGLSVFAPGAHLNKWDALEASKWFSEMVPDGDGGFHPRYSLNVIHNQPMKAEDFIRYLAGAVGGMAWDQGSGEWRLKVDKPESAVDIFTTENIEGEFSYSHTDVDTRFNDYRGTFLNEEFDFQEETIGVVDSTSVALIGHKPTTVALIGCTNRQEALRRLMVRLRSSVRETRVVNFTTNRRADHLIPLETILVADSDLGDQNARTTGRVVSMNAARTQITVRDPMRLEVPVDYVLKFARPNAVYNPDILTQPTAAGWTLPTVVDQVAITNTSGQRGDVTTLYLAAPLPADVAEYLVVALEAIGLPTLPKTFRIISLSKEDDNNNERVTVSAIEVDTGKWAAADGVTAQDSVFVDLTKIAPAPLPPISGSILTLISTPAAQGFNHSIIGNFVRPLGSTVDGFRVTYSVNGGSEQVLSERLLVPTFDMVNPTHGIYQFKIYTRTRTGVYSIPLVASITVDQTTLSAADLAYADGQTLESLQPAAAGADPTGSNISAGITGQGDLATADFANWATQVTGTGKPADYAGTTVSLSKVGPGLITIQGNTATRTDLSGLWNTNIVSAEFYVGTAFVGAVMNGTSQSMVGLTDNPAGTSYADLDYAFYRTLPTAWEIYESGSFVQTVTGVTLNTRFLITYDGVRVRYWADGVLKREVVTTEGRVFRAGGSLLSTGSKISEMSFGPYGQLNWSDVGGTGRPDDNATKTGVGPNMLLDDTYMSSSWALDSLAVRETKNALNGFALGFAPYHLDQTVKATPAAADWNHNYSSRPNVTVGKRYFGSVSIQKNSAVLSTTNITLSLEFWDASGTLVPAGINTTISATQLTAGAPPKQFQVSGLAPAGAVTATLVQYIAAVSGGTGRIRFELPVISEVGSTAAVQGTTAKVVKYDSAIAALSGELPAPLTYSFYVNSAGQSAGVTWTYTVLTGTVNGFTIDDGAKAMTGTGTGTFTISSVGTNAATVRITGVQNGLNASTILSISRDIAAAPVTGGGGGGGSALVTGAVSGSTASSTFADKSGSVTGTMPAGKTTANIAADLTNQISGIGATQNETVEWKLERLISAVWTQIGSTISSLAKERIVDAETGEWGVTNGNVTMNINDTGLTAGVSYSWRISARRSAGSHTNFVSGPITVTAP